MTQEELIKMAESDPELRDALVVFTQALEKTAQEDTQFSETVPAGAPAQGVPQEQAMPPGQEQVPPGQEQMMAAEPTGPNPSQEAAIAAQQFLAPVFDAAAQGDVNAQNTIARAAGEVARGVAEAAAGSISAPMEQAMPVSPEEQVANQVVPPQEEAPAEEIEEEENPDTTDSEEKTEEEKKKKKVPPQFAKQSSMIDADVVGTLIKLARAGKL